MNETKQQLGERTWTAEIKRNVDNAQSALLEALNQRVSGTLIEALALANRINLARQILDGQYDIENISATIAQVPVERQKQL